MIHLSMNSELQINFLIILTVGIVALLLIAAIASNLTAKNHALNIINKLIRIKLSADDIDGLARAICKRLQEDLWGKFAIVLVIDKKKTIYGNADFIAANSKKIQTVLENHHPLMFIEMGKTSYFCPLIFNSEGTGVLLVGVNNFDNFVLGFRKILPSISAQISALFDNFRNRALFNETKINEEKEKLRSLILSSISHDLKSPLSSIISGLSISQKLNKEDRETLLTATLDEAKRLNQFITDVLEMTRIKSGIAIHRQFFNPLRVIRRTLQRFELSLKNYTITTNLSDRVRINFDLIAFEQVTQNLVDNIIKYSPLNTKIAIYEKFCDDSYKIFFQNEGKEIDPEKLHLIFNKFERLTTEEKSYGSGLGLSIVKALMELNNATISAENAPNNQGIIFILRFIDFQK